MRLLRSASVFAAWIVLLALPSAASAPGGMQIQPIGADVTIAPKRLVFDGRSRSAELLLINRGTTPVTYRIEWTQKRMNDQGELVDVETADRPADPMVRYAPRQIALEPGGRQVVRLYLRKPADLPRGEYRSHLLFRALPPADQGADVEKLAEDPGLVMKMSLIFGLSIPVIVRNGDLQAEVGLAEAHFEPAAEGRPAGLSVRLARSGERSVFGDVVATFLPAGGGPEVEVGASRGIAVYPPLAARTLSFPLANPEGKPLRDGKLRLTYAPRAEDDGDVPARQTPLNAEIDLP